MKREIDPKETQEVEEETHPAGHFDAEDTFQNNFGKFISSLLLFRNGTRFARRV